MTDTSSGKQEPMSELAGRLLSRLVDAEYEFVKPQGFGGPNHDLLKAVIHDANMHAAELIDQHHDLLTALLNLLQQGIIYWEPQTMRGAKAKDLLIKQAQEALKKAGVVI